MEFGRPLAGFSLVAMQQNITKPGKLNIFCDRSGNGVHFFTKQFEQQVN